MKNLTKISIAFLLLLQLAAGQFARADVTDDPSTLPLPDFTIQTAQRAIVIKVMFNSATDVVVQSISVANTAAPGAAGKPSIILLESLDENNALINARNEWSPLWEYSWDDDGVESGQVLPAGAGTFYVPLVGNMKSVRISDLTLEQELLTVDVSVVVANYCTANAAATICAGFQSTDSCLPNPCQHGGVCTTETTGYSCGCVQGYSGDNCATDIDECAAGLDNCSANAYCSNTPGSFSCHCNSGYVGDGLSCSVSTPADVTPPNSTATLAPAAPASGWHLGDVIATITATDADSGVEKVDYMTTFSAQITGGSVAGAQATVTIGNEGDGVLSYFATDKAGNIEAPHSMPVRIDRTAPAITAVRSPAANGAGWNNSAVSVSFACTDSLSGVASCSSPQSLGSEGASQSVTGEATDNAGNHASTTVTGISIDTTPPAVTVTGVADAAVYTPGNVPVAACSTSDALSGVAADAVVAVTGGNSNGTGTFTVSCNGAMDVAGNRHSVSSNYAVNYLFNGFAAPVSNPPVVNTLKAGQAVPLKFGLGGDLGLNVLLGGAPTSFRISCASGAEVDAVEELVTSPGASQFAYDPLTSLYQFNWKTNKSWAGTCRRLLLKLDDGTVHPADFKFK